MSDYDWIELANLFFRFFLFLPYLNAICFNILCNDFHLHKNKNVSLLRNIAFFKNDIFFLF